MAPGMGYFGDESFLASVAEEASGIAIWNFKLHRKRPKQQLVSNSANPDDHPTGSAVL